MDLGWIWGGRRNSGCSLGSAWPGKGWQGYSLGVLEGMSSEAEAAILPKIVQYLDLRLF